MVIDAPVKGIVMMYVEQIPSEALLNIIPLMTEATDGARSDGNG